MRVEVRVEVRGEEERAGSSLSGVVCLERERMEALRGLALDLGVSRRGLARSLPAPPRSSGARRHNRGDWRLRTGAEPRRRPGLSGSTEDWRREPERRRELVR